MKQSLLLLAIGALLVGGAFAQNYPPAQQAPPAQAYPQAQSYPPAPVYNGPVMEIPAGTQLQIRTNEAINATKQDIGRGFSAEIASDVAGPNGQILIPRGTPAELTVAQINSTGPLGVGSNQVALAMQSLNLNGRTYMLQSNTTTTQGNNNGIGINKRTAIMTGGGAVLGTIIGAAVGGGKGAAIGAAIGAGGGATAQVLTKGDQVKVPAESLLTFRLDQPVTLQ